MDNQVESEQISPDKLSPEQNSPDHYYPDQESPELNSPEQYSPEMQSPDVQTSNMQEITNTEMLEQVLMENPDLLQESNQQEINESDLQKYQDQQQLIESDYIDQEEQEGQENQDEMRFEEESGQVNNQSEMEKQLSAEIKQDSSLSFDSDNEILRKVRRMLYDNVNLIRFQKDLPPFQIDLATNQVANDYANYLKSNQDDEYQTFYKKLLEQHKNYGEAYLIHISSQFEEDMKISNESVLETFIDIGYLLMESTEERKLLLNRENNHLGLGVSASDEGIVVVQIVSSKCLAISSVREAQNGGLEITGIMLTDKYGLYAVRVLNQDTNEEILKVGPEKITFDCKKKTKDFLVSLENLENPFGLAIRKSIEFYIRQNPDSIAYRRPAKEKLHLKYVTLECRIPCIPYPDPKFMEEAENDLQKMEEEEMMRRKSEDEAKLKRQQEREKRKKNRKTTELGAGELDEEKSNAQQSQGTKTEQDNEGTNRDESMEDLQKKTVQVESDLKSRKTYQEQSKEGSISNKDIKEDLDKAIAEAMMQHEELKYLNISLQEQIKMMKNRNEMFVDKQGDVAMNEHKYLNTLAHVHQIRLDLKQTQDKYNRMAYDLQQKLEEKQKKCNEIKLAFMELKREVAKKAVFSRTDKPIPEPTIDQWEDREIEKNKILQELRLEILRLRNNLAKNQKNLKKKEELAEGLHLIDFEQLKIENQTLNEKIEERNEDLHKLKKKNTNNVQILTHTKEKLSFVQKQNQNLDYQSQQKESELNDMRSQLNEIKNSQSKLRKDNQNLKQQTGIVNSKALAIDFDSRKNRIQELRNQKKQLEEQLNFMNATIIEYDKIKQSSQISSSQKPKFYRN